MKNRLLRLYENGQVTTIGLQKAVHRGWMTSEEFTEYTGEVYIPPIDDVELLINEIIEEVSND